MFRRSRARQARQCRVRWPWRTPTGDTGDDLGRIPAPLVAIERGGQHRVHPGEAWRGEDPRGAAPARGAVVRYRRGPYRQPDVEPSAIPTKVFIGCHRHLHSARPGTEPCVPGSPAGGTTDPRRIGSTVPDYLKPTGLSRPEQIGHPDTPTPMKRRRSPGQTCFGGQRRQASREALRAEWERFPGRAVVRFSDPRKPTSTLIPPFGRLVLGEAEVSGRAPAGGGQWWRRPPGSVPPSVRPAPWRSRPAGTGHPAGASPADPR